MGPDPWQREGAGPVHDPTCNHFTQQAFIVRERMQRARQPNGDPPREPFGRQLQGQSVRARNNCSDLEYSTRNRPLSEARSTSRTEPVRPAAPTEKKVPLQDLSGAGQGREGGYPPGWPQKESILPICSHLQVSQRQGTRKHQDKHCGFFFNLPNNTGKVSAAHELGYKLSTAALCYQTQDLFFFSKNNIASGSAAVHFG